MPLIRMPAESEAKAMITARELVRTNDGTAAVTVTTDEETGEVRSASILSRHGHVPDDFEKSLNEPS